MKQLTRSKTHRMVGGVAGGLAEYLNVDPTIVRLLWALMAFAYGSGLLAYLIAWVIVPEEA